ncbi:MAG: sulfatase-like hydrolase/transferase, partial [Candidatus Omnitrophica bacterium]|nr:sulfatase-like hydrolase/transferase [Candidatus Omnitrophota bacterium]
DKLEELGLDRKTIIIISADHGESLGEHGEYFTHGFNLYDELVKVPLVVRFCSLEPANKRIDAQAGLVDLMPTILELTGAKEPPGIEGRSLMPVIREDNPCSDRYLLSFTATGKLAVRVKNWKLIYDQDSKQYELYDLKSDPKELNNLVFKEREQFKLLKNKLDSRLKQIQYDPRKKNKVILDKESQQRLRSLGYLG